MTDPRWEALRKAAQDVVMDAKAHRDRLVEVVRRGQFSTGYAAGMSGPVAALGAALAALEEPVPALEEVRCRICHQPEAHHAKVWGKGNELPECPAPSSALDREALADAYGIACVNYAPLEGRIGPRDHPKFVRAKDARAALLSAWEAEVAALRAEVEQQNAQMDAWMRKRDRAYAERDAAEAALAAARDAFLADIGRRARVYDAIEEGLLAALATERARALEEAVKVVKVAPMKPLCARCHHDYGQHKPTSDSKDWSCEDCDCDAFYWPETPTTNHAEQEGAAPAPQGEEDGFEGHPPGVCLEHDRFRLEGAGLIDTEGHFDRCTGCGQLPPHAGCKAICAACALPTGACYCAGCQVAGKASPPPAPEKKP